MYRVVEDFADLKDHEHIYRAGETYPRPDVEVSEERVRELLTGRNRLGRPLIEETSGPKVKEAEKAAEEPQEAAEVKPPAKTRRTRAKNAD